MCDMERLRAEIVGLPHARMGGHTLEELRCPCCEHEQPVHEL